VQAAADEADLPGRVYPHCLRATAASYHAYKGVAPVPLQVLMGWSDLATAQKYTVSRGQQRLMHYVVSITGRDFSNVVQ
jgi:site-specific recombinase XerD